jgi:outer membrane protein, heavy metal efflux system
VIQRVCSLLALWPFALLAQVPQESDVLTLERALTLAEQFNPRLQVANAQIQVAAAGIVTARTRPNPEASYLGGHQNLRLPSAASGLLQHWGYSQLIETRSVRRNRIETAQQAREASNFGLEESRLLLRSAVKQAFYQVLRRKSEIEIAQETLKLVEELRQRVQVQVAVGEAGRLELTRSESEVSTAQTLLRSAQLRESAALTELRALIGTSLTERLVLRGTLDEPPKLPNLEEIRQAALKTHPALARMGAEVRRAQAHLETEKALRTPQPVLMAEYEQMPDVRFLRAGVSIPIPIFNRRQGPIGEASATLLQTNSLASALRLEISSAVERAYSIYEIANQQMASIEAGALRGAQAAVEGAEAAFRFGERGIIEVLDAQRVLRSIRSDYLNAQYDRQSALIELEQLKAIELSSTRNATEGRMP